MFLLLCLLLSLSYSSFAFLFLFVLRLSYGPWSLCSHCERRAGSWHGRFLGSLSLHLVLGWEGSPQMGKVVCVPWGLTCCPESCGGVALLLLLAAPGDWRCVYTGMYACVHTYTPALHVCACTHMYMCTCVQWCTHVYLCRCTSVHLFVHVCVHTCDCTHMYVYTHATEHPCVCVHVHSCACTFVYICVSVVHDRRRPCLFLG